MSSPKDKIKERLSIEECISSYIELLPSGKNFKARCPFHNEKTPSFFVSPERNSFYCFGCSMGGDIFTFVEKFEGVDFRGALKILAERTGIKLEYDHTEKKDEKEILYEIMEKATQFFEDEFKKNNLARNYLKERGLTDDTISKFRVGFAPNSWKSVSVFLSKLGFKEEDILKVGLIKKSEKDNGKSFYDRFRGRIMFPIADSSGRVIAFSGRIFGDLQNSDFEQAKYINSIDSILFNKSNTLFGIDKAKLNIRKKGYSILVEGQMDLLMSHQIGLDNTVALSGTALNKDINISDEMVNNLGLIKRLSSNLVFAFDGDEAGLRATRRNAMIALSLDMQVKIVNPLDGRDPADIIKNNPSEWKDLIRNSKHLISFEIDKMVKDSNDHKVWVRNLKEIIFPFIQNLKSKIEQSTYLKEIAYKTGIREDALYTDFESYEKTNIKIDDQEILQKNQIPRLSLLEKQFFSIIFYLEKLNYTDKVKNKLDLLKDKIKLESFDDLYKKYESYKNTLVLEAEMWYGDDIDYILRDLDEVISSLEEEILKLKIKDITDKIRKAEIDKDKDSLNKFLIDYKDLVNKMEIFKNNRK